ncbi:hypothetical protein AALC75_15255 [Lachnospiraceae bacterium 48-42]|nr:hypothetical protein [Dorea sp.]
MKKIFKILLLLFVAVAIAVILGIGFGFGKGTGDGNDDWSAKTTQKETVKAEKDVIDKYVETEQNDNETDANKEVEIFKISVVGNEYFYGNERTSLDDFITKVKEAESDVNVEIKDDNASLKTYKKLIEQLEKSKIPFTEE